MTRDAAGPVPDPRPTVVEQDGVHVVRGLRCVACGHALARRASRCPRCGDEVREASFGPEGVVWAATTVHVSTAGRPAPYCLAYVDVADGPRVLVHVLGSAGDVPVGARVALAAGPGGDPVVRVRS